MKLLSPASFMTICLSIAFTGGAVAQRPTGSITGRVVTEDGQPIPYAKVSIFGVGGISKTMSGRLEIVTDESGGFQADGLDPAPYSISATAPGYVLLPDERISGQLGLSALKYSRVGDSVTIRMLKGGVITGRVTNASGEPVIGIGVEATRVRDETGRKLNGPSGVQAFQANWRTDDRGVYRIYGLAPGVYVVSAGGTGFSITPTPFSGRMKIYHPSATRDAATEVAVRSGEEATGVDIRYRSERGFAISGKISGAPLDGQGVASFSATIITLTKAGTDTVIATTGASAMGQGNGYAVYGLPNGEYEISAFRPNPADASVMFSAPRRVMINGRDLTGIDLVLVPTASLSGAVVLEKARPGSGPTCDAGRDSFLDEIVLRARAADPAERRPLAPTVYGNPGVAVPNEKGVFTVTGLKAGRHFLEPQLPADTWYVKSVVLSSAPANAAREIGRNGVTLKAGEKINGIIINVAEGAAGLKGKLIVSPEKPNAKPPSRLRVYLLPAEAEAKDDVLRFAELIAEDGSFSFTNLAPGKYLLATRPIVESDSPETPALPAAWNAQERAKLRQEAETAKADVELKSCQRVNDFVLRIMNQ